MNVNSINPDRIEGQASAAREIVAQLGGLPDVLALPYGGGGNTTAYLRGFGDERPRILSVQSGERATTVGSAIRIVEPVHREQVEGAAEIVTVSDAELLEWWQAIARLEGLFCEPASAAGVAGRRAGPAGRPRRLRAHRPRAEGPGRGRAAVRTRAPATSANLGPGFDTAGVALDLWNEVEVTRGLRPPARPGAHRHPRVRPRRLARGPVVRVDRPHPARARPRLERGDDRARDGRGGEVDGAGARARGPARARRAARGPLRQPRRLPRRRRHADLGRADRADRRLAAADARWRSIPEEKVHDRRGAARAAGRDPARRRVLQRRACGAARRRDRRAAAPTRSPPRSPTGSTSRTGRRRSSTRSAPSSRAGAVGATLSGSGPDRDRLGRGRRTPAPPSSRPVTRRRQQLAVSPRARTEASLGARARRAVLRAVLEARRPGPASATARRWC